MTNLRKYYLRYLVKLGVSRKALEECGYRRSTIRRYQKALL